MNDWPWLDGKQVGAGTTTSYRRNQILKNNHNQPQSKSSCGDERKTSKCHFDYKGTGLCSGSLAEVCWNREPKRALDI